MLPCRFTGPGIVSTPHMYTRKYRHSRWCIQGRQLAYKWTTGRMYVYAQAASWLVCGYYTRADEHQGSMRIVHKLACHCKAGTSINSRAADWTHAARDIARFEEMCDTSRYPLIKISRAPPTALDTSEPKVLQKDISLCKRGKVFVTPFVRCLNISFVAGLESRRKLRHEFHR